MFLVPNRRRIWRRNHETRPPHRFLAGPQRLNKVLAAAGLGARRQVEELIEQGRVEVDGKVVSEFHVKVDPAVSKISVDGQSLRKQRPVYFAVNKPGVLCTNRDPEGRPRVIDLVPDSARLFPVGRLDRSSVGLILLTNDGTIATFRLIRNTYGVDKTYFVVVQGRSAMTSWPGYAEAFTWPKEWRESKGQRFDDFEKVAPNLKSV